MGGGRGVWRSRWVLLLVALVAIGGALGIGTEPPPRRAAGDHFILVQGNETVGYTASEPFRWTGEDVRSWDVRASWRREDVRSALGVRWLCRVTWSVESEETGPGGRERRAGVFPPPEVWRGVVLPRLRELAQPPHSPEPAPNGAAVTYAVLIWRNLVVWTMGVAGVVGLGVFGAWCAVLSVRGRRAREWRFEGRCSGCGYEVVGVDVCPECGRRVKVGGERG